MSASSYKLSSPRKLFRGVAIVTLAASFSFASISNSLATNENPAPLEIITIAHGDSLWLLAGVYAPDQDPRDWIAEVVSVNSLETATIVPGQRISLPR